MLEHAVRESVSRDEKVVEGSIPTDIEENAREDVWSRKGR